jgi:hypothetical protein
MNVGPEAAAPAHVAGFWRRRTASLFRWLHIYLSMVSFAILFFFAVTGITLNHADWFYRDAAQTVQERGHLDRAWVNTTDDAVAKLEVVEHLRRVHALKGAVSEFRIEAAQCAVSFRGPGYAAEAFVDRATGDYELAVTRMGFVAVINDLHKGRDSGRGWAALIDVAGALMVVVSLTGLVLVYFVRRRFVTGVITALFGALACGAVYVWLVP